MWRQPYGINKINQLKKSREIKKRKRNYKKQGNKKVMTMYFKHQDPELQKGLKYILQT